MAISPSQPPNIEPLRTILLQTHHKRTRDHQKTNQTKPAINKCASQASQRRNNSARLHAILFAEAAEGHRSIRLQAKAATERDQDGCASYSQCGLSDHVVSEHIQQLRQINACTLLTKRLL